MVLSEKSMSPKMSLQCLVLQSGFHASLDDWSSLYFLITLKSPRPHCVKIVPASVSPRPFWCKPVLHCCTSLYTLHVEALLPDASQGCIPATLWIAWMRSLCFLWYVLSRFSFNDPALTQKRFFQQRLSHHHSELSSEGAPLVTGLPMCHNHRKLGKEKVCFKKKQVTDCSRHSRGSSWEATNQWLQLSIPDLTVLAA